MMKTKKKFVASEIKIMSLNTEAHILAGSFAVGSQGSGASIQQLTNANFNWSNGTLSN